MNIIVNVDKAGRMVIPEDIRKELGITDNWFVDLFTYFFNILPFPKTVCLSSYSVEVINGEVSYDFWKVTYHDINFKNLHKLNEENN